MVFKWWLLLYLVILGFLSLNPWLLPDPSQAIGFITWDLLDHAAAYGLLSVLMMLTFMRYDSPWAMALVLVLASSLLGVLFEYGQHWLTLTRQFSLYDAMANVFGAVLGVVVFLVARVYLSGYLYKQHK